MRSAFIFAVFLAVFSAVSFSAEPVHAAPASFKGYLKLPQGHEVYVDYSAPLDNQPTVVLLNGLVYNMARWQPYVDGLKKQGVGVVRYYFRGQSLTLLREAPPGQRPKFFDSGLDYAGLSSELDEVLDTLQIQQKINVVGLSYGASIAAEYAETHAQRVDNLILMAPLVVSLDNYNPMGAWIRQNLNTIRLWWGPLWGPTAYDFYYNMIYRSYLVNDRITPDRIPPELASIPDTYKEAIFHLVRAARDFDLKSYSFAKVPQVTLMLSDEEDSSMYRDQLAAWEAWTPSSRASLVSIKGASHAIPDSQPALAALLTNNILAGNKGMQNGRLYLAADMKLTECKDMASFKAKDCH